MHTHVKVLAVLNIALGALGLIASLFVLLIFGGTAGLLAVTAESSDALIASPIVGLIGGVVALVLFALSVPGIIAGVGLLKLRPWARILGLILGVLNLLHFPLGTVVGLYGLWVLLSQEGAALFTPP